MLCFSWSFLDIGFRHCAQAGTPALVPISRRWSSRALRAMLCSIRTTTLTGLAPRPFASSVKARPASSSQQSKQVCIGRPRNGSDVRVLVAHKKAKMQI